MVKVRKETLQRAYSKIVDDGKDLHISGQPGIGKTEFLNNLTTEIPSQYTVKSTTVRAHHDHSSLERDLLHLVRRAAPERDTKRNQLISASAGAGPISGGGTVDDRVRDLYKLEDLTENWSNEPLLLCIDDIHKIADDEQVVRDIIGELSSSLGQGVQLITLGQIRMPGGHELEDIHLNLYTLGETRVFLQEEFGNLPEDTVRDVHSVVEGHPLYLSLLTESSEDETDFDLPEYAVLDTIEERYLEALPQDTVKFLRQFAPLPELSEKLCAGLFEEWDALQIDQKLRELDRRVIVQQVNRTDDGDKIYKIHERFRTFLVRKNRDADDVHRRAFQYHLQEVTDMLAQERDEKWVNSLPHWFYARYHLDQVHGENAGSEAFREELDRIDLTYPHRGLVMLYAGVCLLPGNIFSAWEQELPLFREWVFDTVENQQQAELVVRVCEWALSQLGDEPMELSEIQIEGSLDDLPEESQVFNDVELADAHLHRLRKLRGHILRFLFLEEPYQSKAHRELMINVLSTYGISKEILSQLKQRIKSVLKASELGEEFDQLIEQYAESIGTEFENSLNSSLDFYELRDQAMNLGREAFDNLHYDLLLDSGLIHEIALEGGEVLEEAENPVFAMVWYSLFATYFRNANVVPSAFDQVKEKYMEQLERRKQYEQSIEHPIIFAEDSAEGLSLDEQD